MRATSAQLAALLALGLLLPSCAPKPPSVRSHWPLFSARHEGERSEVEALGPLVFYRREPGETVWGVRPLFSVRREGEPERSTWHVLYPLSFWRSEPGAGLQYAFPLYFHYHRPSAAGGRVSATALFPFFWWGEHPEGGSWFFLFPVGGVAKGLLGKDEVVFAGANAYIETREGDYVTRHVLWPFFSVSRGPGRRALRLWPLYGRGEREGQWANGFVLWPFVTYGRREATRTKDAADYFCLWPLYGRSRSRDGASGSVQVLWPFFFYAWNRRTGYREWDLPFPFVRGRRTETVRTTNVWPLFGRRTYKAGSDTYVLWPLVHASRVRGRSGGRDSFGLFPFLTHARSWDAERSSRRSFWMVWPLWRSRSRQEGEERWGDANSLQFAWFKWSEGFDRNFNALLGLFEHERARDGRRSTSLLWRLFRWESGPAGRSARLGPLASWSRSGRLTRAGVLLGLFETGQRDGKRGWRILLVPIGADLTDPPHPPVEGEARGRQ